MVCNYSYFSMSWWVDFTATQTVRNVTKEVGIKCNLLNDSVSQHNDDIIDCESDINDTDNNDTDNSIEESELSSDSVSSYDEADDYM